MDAGLTMPEAGGRTLAELSWDEAATMEPIDSETQLMRRLEEIERCAERPALVKLFLPDGSSLAIGLGRASSVVTYLGADGADELSRGEALSEEPVLFYLHGADSEFPPDAAIPREAAFAAMRSFLRSGKRPGDVEWRPP